MIMMMVTMVMIIIVLVVGVGEGSTMKIEMKGGIKPTKVNKLQSSDRQYFGHIFTALLEFIYFWINKKYCQNNVQPFQPSSLSLLLFPKYNHYASNINKMM
mmetsp:Transcript_734/g.1266  ORF Transcript_734/g.1266 Transcript_734/m.1266 type:complete len:101 (+) Transcript_734:119-421(+)